MNRARLVLMSAAAALLPVAVVACGDDAKPTETLPPIYTTTTTTTLFITTTTHLEIYEVKSGDGLGKIAEKFGVTIDELMAANGITNPDHIEVGQKLKIPPPVT
ncbi:MAG TPA: LysM domain-containing protein, partial [Actinomycetota bacterium]|nr:LysM domain-containing protein [Actinomycetota bacterium]